MSDSIFGLPILQAINDWQRGGSERTARKRGERLKELCVALPEQHRTTPSACFRQIALTKGHVWNLLGRQRLGEKISAWTLDLAIAKTFKGGVPPENQGFQGVIFERAPPKSEIIVNLWSVYRDADFLSAVELHKRSISHFDKGIGCYSNRQSEIVLEVEALFDSDIHSLGGHSSSFDELVRRAAFEIYKREPTHREFTELKSKVSQLEPLAGARWLDRDSTHRVLKRIEGRAQYLRRIKTLQVKAGTAQR